MAWLLELFGWRYTFVVLGLVGLVWGIFWYLWFRDDPEDHQQMSTDELSLIKANVGVEQESTKPSISIDKLFTSKAMWLIMGQYFASNFTFFFCLTWLFPHLKTTYNLDTVEAGFYSSAPLIFGALGNWFSGFLVDSIFKRNKWELSRKAPAIIGFLLASAGIVGSTVMTEVTGAIVCLSLAVFGADMTLSPSWSTCVDVGKQFSGAVSGTMNMAGNIGSFVTALAFPYLLEITGSAIPFFYVAATLNVIAVLIWLRINPTIPLKLIR